MVWPFSSSSSSSSSDPKSDPYSKLDPSLRQFLDRESPNNYTPSTPPERPVSAREQAKLIAPEEPAAPVPVPSLYPDGRYAHLWKNYRSRAAIESEHRSDQEKLTDVLRSYKDRKADVAKAALENCAGFDLALDECIRKPTMAQRAVMCRYENRAMNRCVEMNKQFLKALGYLNVQRTAEEEEAIQMHADKLYTNMLAKEKEIETARAEGREVPEMQRMFDDTPQRPNELDTLTEKGRAQLEQRTKDLNPAEKELEERVFAAEIRAGTQTIANLEKHREEVRQARQARIDSGKARPLDAVQKWFGW